jgi:hypothetical protein
MKIRGEFRLSPRFANRRLAYIAVIALAMLCVTAPICTAASIDVGSHVLLPNTANQIISIWVTGGGQVAGEDFFAQVGDGGAFNGGVNTKPTLTNVDIVTSSIFAANNSGAYGDPGNAVTHPLIWVDGTTTQSGTVVASGRLAAITFDTTGLSSGTFPLLLTDVASSLGSFSTALRSANGSTAPLTIANGSVIVGTPIAGDFNLDGAVDASDYVVWRKGLGTSYTQSDYDVWRAHFGQTVGGGAVATTLSAIPEPATLMLVFSAATLLSHFRRRVLALVTRSPGRNRSIAN